MNNQTLEKLYIWLKETSGRHHVYGGPYTYIRGWHDCIHDVLRKIEEFETEKEAAIKDSLTTEKEEA